MKYGPWRADGTQETTTKPDKPKRGRPRKIDREKIAAVIKEFGLSGATKLLGTSRMTTWRIAKEFNLPPLNRGCLSKEKAAKLQQALKDRK